MHSKAYRIYKPQTKTIVISRDVVFMEEDHWDWNADESGQISHMQPSEDNVNDLPPRVKFCENDGAVKVEEKYYISLLGCLMYLTASRPDIMHVVSLLSRFMHCASEEHLQAAKRVVRYVKGTVDFGIKYVEVTKTPKTRMLRDLAALRRRRTPPVGTNAVVVWLKCKVLPS
ncbi:Retrovirus-related Pol polyprotein from transposon RE2 [Senna tora]|uniref:Retrovirus-related Pol polyprotein from transposon RE2 n=1 Tax=Senna tora TaxID=362788 RepID=A0A834TZJ9_9FABA|nr:Retrovirus-related Pol polyprotein from transposon RE2 [Senna tora]